MISNMELQYVNSFAKNAPYPGDKYAEQVMEMLIEAHEIFKNKYEGKKYSLILSNGEEFNFELKNKNLSHLLGIDFKNLTNETMIYDTKEILGFDYEDRLTSYDILQKIIEHCDDIIANDRDNDKTKRILNYYKVMIKCSCFSKLSRFEDFNFGFMNFDKEYCNPQLASTFSPNSTKYIFTENDEVLIPYYMMGFVQDNQDYKSFVPETLLAPYNFDHIIENQEFLLPIQLLINNEDILLKKESTASEKLKLLNLYKKIILQYGTTGIFINVLNDYESRLKEDSIKHLKR